MWESLVLPVHFKAGKKNISITSNHLFFQFLLLSTKLPTSTASMAEPLVSAILDQFVSIAAREV